MPKSKKKNKRAGTRRRRVGAMALKLNANSPVVQIGSAAIGFMFADKINEQIDKVVPPDKIDSKIVAGAQIGLGAAYIYLMKGKKSLPLTIVSGVLAGAGIKRGLTAFGLGYVNPYAIGYNPSIAINGYQNVPAINGYQNVPSVNGVPKRVGAYNPGNGGMSMNARRKLSGLGSGSGVMDRN